MYYVWSKIMKCEKGKTTVQDSGSFLTEKRNEEMRSKKQKTGILVIFIILLSKILMTFKLPELSKPNQQFC